MFKKTQRSLLLLLLAFPLIFPIEFAENYNNYYYRRIRLEKQEAKSTLYLTPIKKRFGDYILMDLIVNPNGDEINTVSADIHFPIDKLEFKGFNKKDSFCAFFIEEKTNNEEGWAKISCLKPYPGVKELSNVAGLIFKEKRTGEATITFGEDTVILANDGYGTDVLKEAEDKTIIIY